MPLIRRLPKRGFNNAAFHKNYALVNLSDLQGFESGAVVNEAALREAKLIRGNFHGIKILGDGELKHGLTIEADKVSASARQKIEAAGGTISERARKRESTETNAAEITEARPAKQAKVQKTRASATRKKPAKK